MGGGGGGGGGEAAMPRGKSDRKFTFSAPAANSMLRVSEKQVLVVADDSPWYIIQPNGSLRLSWDAIMVALVLYVALVEPFRIAFEYESPNQTLVSSPPGWAGPRLRFCDPGRCALRSGGSGGG